MDTADDLGLATLHPHLDASSMAAVFPNPKSGRGGSGAGGMVAPGRSVHELSSWCMSLLFYTFFFIGEEDFQLALFRNSNRKNLFADRIFILFDRKHNGVIEFEEFVRSLHIFHPDTPTAEKIAFAFRLYDLRGSGSIEREELKEMVLAILNESDLPLIVKLWKSCSFPRKSQGGSSPDPCQCNIGHELWPKVVILLDIFAWVLSWAIYPLCSVKIQLFFLGTSRT